MSDESGVNDLDVEICEYSDSELDFGIVSEAVCGEQFGFNNMLSSTTSKRLPTRLITEPEACVRCKNYQNIQIVTLLTPYRI